MKQKITFVLLMCFALLQAQAITVKGLVIDQVNEPVIGASVRVEGTTIGTVTDYDGNFELTNVPDGAKIIFSYLGMQAQTLTAQSDMTVQLVDDIKNLDEVVVIGYGTAQAKDLTSPISVVGGEELLSTPTSSPMTAMQGKVSGVNVVSSGTPGASPSVTIRGNGSFSSNSPLYVVDGMFYDNIDFLSSSDIQEMSILKDASAAAIYGVRAANGVVIITTKHGYKNQDAKISYTGYVGFQKATNVLKMANSSQYATMLLEANYDAYVSTIKSSIDRFGGSYADSDYHNWTYGSDTDWYKELLRTALITDHSLTISGGGEKATYSVGMNYLYQDGVMNMTNNYKRLNFRAALDYDATKWLTIGFNGVFSKSKQVLPNNAAWQQAFNAPGLYPVYDSKNTDATPEAFASPGSIGYTANFYNPVASTKYYDSKNETNHYLTNFYARFNILSGNRLFFRTSYSYDYSNILGRTYTPSYYVSSWQQASTSSLTKMTTTNYDHIWDNTLTYKDTFGDHTFGAMLGFSMREENYRYLWNKANNVPGDKDEYKYISQGDASTITGGDNGTTYRGMSYFARLNYDYMNKYLLMFTMRADGSSKYQEKWGYFPSIGAAWVISNEDFMRDQHVFDYLKLRASWGSLGNDHVAASDGFASIATGNSASGVYGNTTIAGYQNTTYFSYLKWEKVNETNIGVNFATFNNRLSVDVDYFYRLTKNAVISARLPFTQSTLAGNYGKIRNQGVDVEINWADRIGHDFKYNIGVNMTYMTNKIKSLSGLPYIDSGETYQIVGEQMNSFYGYKVIGVYQTEEECAADATAVANGLQPGDFKYEDVNGDGIVDGNDRTALGSYQPNFIYGINVGFEWKGLDFSLATYGQAGAQMYNRKRALRYAQSNYNFDYDQYKNRWTGAGTTNSYPSSEGLIRSWNVSDQRVNSFFVEDADYFRIQNITLGYTLRNLHLGHYTLPRLRFSLTADRPLTCFKANAFTPELSDAQGWDTQVYPLTATYTFGLQIDF